MSVEDGLIVGVDELRNHMNGITLDGDQQKAAENILRGLQMQVERFLRRPITIREFTRIARADAETGLFWTHTPLRSITSITYGSTAVDPAYYNVSLAGGLCMYGYAWGDDLTVVYVAGLDGTSDDMADLRLLILDAASRGMTHRHDNTLSVRGITGRVETAEQNVDPNEIRLTDGELATIQWLQRKSVY